MFKTAFSKAVQQSVLGSQSISGSKKQQLLKNKLHFYFFLLSQDILKSFLLFVQTACSSSFPVTQVQGWAEKKNQNLFLTLKQRAVSQMVCRGSTLICVMSLPQSSVCVWHY